MDGGDGAALKIGEDWELRFERRLAHPADRVWAAITGQAAMSRWFERYKGSLAAAGVTAGQVGAPPKPPARS